MGMIVLELVICGRLLDLPRRNMFAYTAKDVDEAVRKHLEMKGGMPKRVFQWGGMFYMDMEGRDGDAKR